MPDTGGAQRHPAATARLLYEWEHGDLAKQIQWGKPGDFARCVVLATKIFTEHGVTKIDPKAFCSNRHEGATGFRPGHAPGEQDGNSHRG